MMFDLEVEHAHPPVDEGGGFHIGRVRETVFDPMGLLLGDGKVGVGQGEITKHVIRSEPVRQAEGPPIGDHGVGGVPVNRHHHQVQVISSFNSVPGTDVDSPSPVAKKAVHREE